jgi:hypothetical protein
MQEAARGAEMTSDRLPTSLQRPDERLAAFPDGLLVLGDAISSVKPCSGQGMRAAALRGKARQQWLAARAVQRHGLDGLAQAVFPPAAAVIVTPWTLAATQDLASPQTPGARPADGADSAQSFAAFDALTVEDIAVHRLVTEVFHLGKPLSAVHEEPLRSRVLAQQQQQAPA